MSLDAYLLSREEAIRFLSETQKLPQVYHHAIHDVPLTEQQLKTLQETMEDAIRHIMPTNEATDRLEMPTHVCISRLLDVPYSVESLLRDSTITVVDLTAFDQSSTIGYVPEVATLTLDTEQPELVIGSDYEPSFLKQKWRRFSPYQIQKTEVARQEVRALADRLFPF